MKTAFSSFIYSRRGIYGILHILILLMSLFLVISISIDTFHNIPFLNQGSYHQPFYFPAGIYTLFKYH